MAARDPRRAGDLLAAAARLGVTVRLTAFSDPGEPAPGLLVSTAPAGAADSYAERISRAITSRAACSTWCITRGRPRWRRPPRRPGCPVAGGFSLLLHQAARQVELMTGKSAPVEAMRAAGLDALATRV